MSTDMLDLYRRASAWTAEKVGGADGHLDDRTPCDEWDVRTLLNHMLETQQYFIGSARGERVELSQNPRPNAIGSDPAAAFARARTDMLDTFGADGVIEKTGPALGIAFSDALLHGWDVARATGQDATMPDGLAEAAYQMIHGRFTDEQRKGVFGPEIPVGSDASAQARLLAYTGRTPD
jgi:uncharacterized protein (TIGR03086 family)